MTNQQIALLVISGAWLLTVVIANILLSRRAKKLEETQQAASAEARRHEEEINRIRNESKYLVDQHLAAMASEAQSVQEQLEAQARAIQEEVAPLRRFAALQQAGIEADKLLSDAIKEATDLRADANRLLELAKRDTNRQRAEAVAKAKRAEKEAEAQLAQAARDAARIVAEANRRANEIGGDAYKALQERDSLESAIKAVRNLIDGYGDRYVVPTRSVLDELAADYGHTAAGLALQNARDHSKRMVLEGHAAECDYAEATRRDTAVRFVIDAFNGRVGGILSRAKHDNIGTLRQEIVDSASIVNLNGGAFRNARITQDYINARLEELRWASAVQELKLKEREEQRRIQEQIREEERARREYERAIKEAQRDEEALKRALDKARQEVATASEEQKARFEQQMAELSAKLVEAEARNQRAMSMAQQTRAGHVYIISNIGSFGEDVFKIGMTRRLEPLDRVRELGDASVPFEFDVHAMVYSDDAPTLERALHQEFEDHRVNMVNDRKEFFRVPVTQLRDFVAAHRLEASFTMTAEAHEYRESKALAAMSRDERAKYRNTSTKAPVLTEEN